MIYNIDIICVFLTRADNLLWKGGQLLLFVEIWGKYKSPVHMFLFYL